MEAFCISLSKNIKAIAGLIPITLYSQKLNGHYYLCYTSISFSYATNSLLSSQHTKSHLSTGSQHLTLYQNNKWNSKALLKTSMNIF